MSSSISDSYDKKIHKPNFTQVPNVVFDYWLSHLDHSSSLVLLYLCRKTFGYHKDKDNISLRQIQDGIKMSKQTVINSIKILESHNLIKKQMHVNHLGDQDPNTYELIVNDEVVQNLDNAVKDLDGGGCLENRLGVVQNLDTQKKTLQKKNNINNICAKNLPEKIERRGKFVQTSEEHHLKLIEKYGQEMTDKCYDHLMEWKQSKAEADPRAIDKHTDFFRIGKWVHKAIKEEEEKKNKPEKDWKKINANYVYQSMKDSGDVLKHIIFDGDFVKNTRKFTELSLKMQPSAFEVAFPTFAGVKNG